MIKVHPQFVPLPFHSILHSAFYIPPMSYLFTYLSTKLPPSPQKSFSLVSTINVAGLLPKYILSSWDSKCRREINCIVLQLKKFLNFRSKVHRWKNISKKKKISFSGSCKRRSHAFSLFLKCKGDTKFKFSSQATGYHFAPWLGSHSYTLLLPNNPAISSVPQRKTLYPSYALYMLILSTIACLGVCPVLIGRHTLAGGHILHGSNTRLA